MKDKPLECIEKFSSFVDLKYPLKIIPHKR